jgi:GxxExxY protein
MRLDLLVDKTTIVELKATKSLKDDDSAQLKRYMKTTGIPKGLLVNFGDSRSLATISHEQE